MQCVRADPIRTDQLEVELIAEQGALVAGGRTWLAVRLHHAPQWHTYWRNPGDAGAATRVSWDLPPGFNAGALEWPVPSRIPVPPLANYGYEGDVLLLAPLVVPALGSGDQATLRAHVDWLVCKEVCIPGSADLVLTLPIVQGSVIPDARWSQAFERARARMPRAVDGLVASAKASGRVVDLDITCLGCTMPALRSAYFFAAAEGLVEPSRAQALSQQGQGGGAIRLRLPVALDLREQRSPLEGVLVTDPALAADAAGIAISFALEGTPLAGLAAVPAEPALRPPLLSFATLLALALALAGGVVLNLMPCVFPVLSLKILAFVSDAHGDAREARANGAAFAAGIVVSFLVLGIVVVALREAGSSLGWGFQLQSPWAVASLAALFLVLALNLLGAYEVALPAVGGGSAEQARATRRSARASAFLSGTLAAIVASPCTAPFMGAALGYALVQESAGALGIFAAIGLGMALPYVLLTRSPALLRSLPRPGPWLLWLRRALALPLLGTVAWLLWVLEQQTDSGALRAVLIGLGLIGVAAMVHGRVQFRGRPGWEMAALLLASGGIALAGVGLSQGTSDTSVKSVKSVKSEPEYEGSGASKQAAAIIWQPWSPEAVDAALARGESVFVDFTAAWCITCQVNKKLVLERSDIDRLFAERSVRRMRADWTRRDERIADALARLGRNGVPVYVLYRPEQSPLVLPEVLTTGVIEAAITAK